MKLIYIFLNKKTKLFAVILLSALVAGAQKISLPAKESNGLQKSSPVQTTGPKSIPITTLTDNTTLDSTHNTVLGNTSIKGFTITLPVATGISGRTYTIKKIGSGGIDNALTIVSKGGAIDGAPNYIIYNDYTFVTLQADNNSWKVIKN